MLARAAALRLTDEAGLAGLVLTPMGAGIGGLADEQCARCMADEVRRFQEERPRLTLQSIVFACLSERTARAFREALRAEP